MKHVGWTLWLMVIVCLFYNTSLKSPECSKPCNVPLGLANGLLKDDQLSAFSAYNNDFSTFGAFRARLNLTTSPPGYRANKGFSDKLPWIKIELQREMTITGISTQGYGDETIAEWITSYRLMYALKSVDFSYFMDLDGEVLHLEGNQDSNSVRRHELPVPAIASKLKMMPTTWHNNIGLRMEIYGCEPSYYFEAWLMFDNIPFTLNHMDSSSDEYKQIASRATNEIHSYLHTLGGYIYNRVLKLSPQSPEISTFVTAEIAIYCTESSVNPLVARLESLYGIDYIKIKYPLGCSCGPPTVDVQLIHHSRSKSDVIMTTDGPFWLKALVTSNCSESNQTRFSWKFSTVDRETKSFSPFLKYGPVNRDTIRLWPNLFGAGLLYAAVEVSVSENSPETSGHGFGFVTVRMPALIAKIVGPASIPRTTRNVTIDGSWSYDPAESQWLQHKGLNFSWRCQRTCLWDPVDVIYFPKPEVEPCYGIANATDITLSNQGLLNFDAASLRSNCTYVFQMAVTKDNRISYKRHKLQIKPAVPFFVRCINNCRAKVSPMRLLTLKVDCANQLCISLATFSWTVHLLSTNERGKFIWTEFKNTTGSVTTSANTTQFDIPRLDALLTIKEGQKFQIKVKATDRSGLLQEQVLYTMNVNSPPKQLAESKDTGCKVSPREGSAILTDFYISCLGWYDKDIPLRYAFKYTFSSSTVIIQDGGVGNVTSKLPLGDPAKDYERILELQIIDAYGEFSTVLVKTKVRPPPASEALLNLIREAQGEMRNLVQGGNVDKAADMAITILSVVDNNEKLKKDETFKDSVLNIMAGVKVDRLNLVTKVTVITAYSTKRVDQTLPQSSQEDAVTLLRKTTTFLNKMDSSLSKELKVLKQIKVNIVTSIGNVLTSSSKDVNIEFENETVGIDKEKGKKITNDCVEIVNTITEEEFCENPTIITTPYLNLTACIEKATEMRVSKLLKGESGIQLPDAKDLFPGDLLDDNTIVDVKLVSFKNNPYTWHPKSRDIKSSVLDVTLKNVTSGKALHVEGLTKPVEMYIKNWHREKEEKEKKKKPQREFYVKPSPPKSIKNMRFHNIFLPYGDAEANIRIVPSNDVELEVYIRYRVRPTPAENNFQTLVPDFSSCLSYTEQDGYFNCESDPYLFTISPKITGHTGTHFLGIRYVEKALEKNITQNQTRTRRSCRSTSGRQKRSCVEVKDPPSTANTMKLEFQNSTDVMYNLYVTMGACMYWSVEDDEWTNRGCQLGGKATPAKLHCLCNHLSAFGGDLFVAPNPIDFDKVVAEFGKLGETGNFVVLSFVCVVFGLYVIGLVIARRADKKDDIEVAPNIHLKTGGDCTSTYDISIQTGIWRNCGTTAKVTIILYGENGCTPPILLTQNRMQKKFFARGSVNTFTLHLPESLGQVYKIKIWHDNSGESPAWFFHQVLISCNATDEKWYFLANRWLALEKSDGKIEVEINCAGKNESLSFRNLFYFRGAKTLGEKHLWLSLFTKAPHNTFTRCQRLSCCLSILFATMVTNAMFYQQGIATEDSFKLGPIRLSWTQIKIGLQSGLVSIPVNAVVVAIFRNIKPVASKESNTNQDDDDADSIGCFPHYCVYIGWALCLMTSLVSAAFVVFYSLMWGKEVANQWLTSVMISFIQDVIFIQPIKVVILVSLLSIVLKKPIENDEVYGQGHSNQNIDKIISHPPREEDLHEVRSVRVLRSRLVQAITEMVMFIVFLSLLMMVCYGNRDSTRYKLTEAIQHVFTKFEKVNSIEEFWIWTRENLVPGLFDVKWYNGQPFSYKEGFIRSREAFIVGMPRLRQKRVKKEPNCQAFQIEPQVVKQFSRCILHYSAETEDRTKYHFPKWIPAHNNTEFEKRFERFFLCPRPWRYETAEELETLSFQGLMSTYSGGGYVADLGYNTEDALRVIDSLEINDWIDNMTAAVFIEFTVHQPASSFYSVVKFLFERFPSGGTNTITQVKTLTIYSPKDPNFRGFYETCQLLFMLMILVCVLTEIGKIYQHGCKHFKSPWSWLEMVLLASSFASLAMFFLKESYTSEFIGKVQENPFQSWSMDNIVLWSDLEVTLLAFVVFLMTMKLLRIIRFNPHIIQMRMTLAIASKHFLSFTFAFMTIITAYVTLTVLTFGRNVYEYRSYARSFSSILLMLIGSKAPFDELRQVSVIIGPFFVFAYMVTIMMIFLNMFLAILNDAYTESRETEHQGLDDLKLSKLINRKVKKTAKKTKEKAIQVIQALPQFVWQKQPETAVTFENEVTSTCSFDENDEDSTLNSEENPNLSDIIRLLSGIKDDIGNSVLSIDDVVPMVTIYDADKRWSRRTDGSLEDVQSFYSSCSLFSSESDNQIYYFDNYDEFLFLVKEWNRKNAEVGETFV